MRNPLDMTAAEIEAYADRPCVECGHPARSHIHLFGTAKYLCPTVSTFLDPQTDVPASLEDQPR